MKLPILVLLAWNVLATAVQMPQAAAAAAPPERYWPQWRGPHMHGRVRTATPPLEWSETKNIRWKVEIPGRGSASPDRLGRSRVSC